MAARWDVDIAKLRRDVALAWGVWAKQMGGLQMMVMREKGVRALERLKLRVLASHQEGHYLAGLKKLGIEGDPPAVTAAKYHYLSNRIGGINLEYAEESPRRAWIRYTGPNHFYAGCGALAVPASVQRTVFAAWHALNAEKMGCPRLGYVCTKVYQDGEPYDEGYFIEYDHDIGARDAVRYERALKTPEYDPDKAPRLDPARWPEARILRAKRKYAGAYVATVAGSLHDAYGEKAAGYMIDQTLRVLAMQYVHEIAAETSIAGTGVADLGRLLHRLLDAREDDATLDVVDERRAAITLRSYKPFAADAPEAVRRAFFAFPEQCVRILNGRVRLNRVREGPETEIWQLEDTGRWLY